MCLFLFDVIACIYVYTAYVCTAQRVHKRVYDLELELETIVGCHVGAGKS